MNIGVITQPNSKGQIVIPAKFREALELDSDVHLSLTLVGEGIFIQPVTASTKIPTSNDAFLALLEKTQGAWGPLSKEEEKKEKARRKLELDASKRRKNAW